VKQRRSLNVQAAVLVVGTGTAQILVAAVYILTARGMQPDQFGSVVTAIGLGMAGAGFVDLGANSYLIRELASHRISRRELNARVSNRFVVVLGLAAIVVVGAALTAPGFVATGVLLLTTSTVQTLLVPLRAAQRSETVGWLIAIGRAFTVVIFWGQTAIGVASSSALWMSLALGDLALMACILVVTPSTDRLLFAVRRGVNPWSGAQWYAVSTASVSAQQLDLPILAAISGATAAGIYGGVNRWIQPLLLAVGAFTAAAAPFFAAATRIVVLKQQLLRASWILVTAVTLCLVVFATAPWLVTVLLGQEYSDSAPVLRWLALAVLLNTINQPLFVALQSRNFDQLAAVIVAVTVGIQLVCVASLAPAYGALAPGVSMFIGQSVSLVLTFTCVAVIVRRRRFSRNGGRPAEGR
jgi:O-antigen/teichoic acid export membrane protein